MSLMSRHSTERLARVCASVISQEDICSAQSVCGYCAKPLLSPPLRIDRHVRRSEAKADTVEPVELNHFTLKHLASCTAVALDALYAACF